MDFGSRETCKVAMLVLLYNKQPSDSITLSSIKKILSVSKYFSLHIVNNGPLPINYGDDFFKEIEGSEVFVEEHLDNIPLSIIYNNFIFSCYYKGFDKFVILDDDTNLDSSFIKSAVDLKSDISCPLVYSLNGNVKEASYPREGEKKLQKLDRINCNVSKDFYSIGSGLVFSRRIVSVFLENRVNLFDVNYSFYGVDSSFFKRLRVLCKEYNDFYYDCNYIIYHDLSSSGGKYTGFRLLEQIWDRGITLRRYPTITDFKLTFKFFLKCLVKFDFKSIFYIFYSFLKGKHPKSKKYEKMSIVEFK